MGTEKEIVKRKLWTFAFSVKDVSSTKGLGFQLIVDGFYKVKVYSPEDIEPFMYPSEKVRKGEVIAVVDRDHEIQDSDIVYYTDHGIQTSPLLAFPKVENTNK